MTRHNGRIGAAVPVFRVASVARSMAWYEDVLDFSPDPAGPPDDPSFAILRRDGVELMLQRVTTGVGGPRSARIAGGGWDVYIRVDDVQALYDACSYEGAGRRTDRWAGVWMSGVRAG